MFTRHWSGFLGALAAGALFSILLWGGKESRAAYQATTWHVTATLSGNSNTTVYSVPSGVDLTVTDIVYTFSSPNLSFADDVQTGNTTCTVYDGGTAPNPTNYAPGTPPPAVSDSATMLWVTDMFHVPLDQFADEMETWKTVRLQRTGIDPTDPMGHRSVLKFANLVGGTFSHHFQTGLVIPAGNDLKAAVGSTGFGSGVTIHLSGILQ
jgi:hypothetical protein